MTLPLLLQRVREASGLVSFVDDVARRNSEACRSSPRRAWSNR